MTTLALLTLLPHTAHAQDGYSGHFWLITYASSGSYTMHYLYGSQYGPALTQTGPWIDTPNETGGGNGAGGQYAVDAQTAGGVTATLTWVPYDGETVEQDPPPANVYVQETASASWDADDWVDSVPDASGASADDGLGDLAVETLWGAVSSGTRLIQRDGSSGQIVVSCGLSAQSPPSTQGPGDGGGYSGEGGYSGGGVYNWNVASVSVSFSVLVVDRAVAITSGIEDSFYKWPFPTSGSDRWQHQRAADGSMIVDSVVGWGQDSSGYNTGWKITDFPFTANTANFNDPRYACSPTRTPTAASAGAESLGSEEKAILSIPQGATTNNPIDYSLFDPNTDDFPVSSMLIVNVTDSDQVQGTNTYFVTWHLPYEASGSPVTTHAKKKLQTLGGPVYLGDPISVKQQDAQDFPFDSLLDGVSEIAAAAGQEEAAAVIKIIAAIATVATTSLHSDAVDAYTDVASDQQRWHDALADTNAYGGGNVPDDLAGFTDDQEPWERCVVCIHQVEHDTIQTWPADEYDLHGYNSSGHTLAFKKVDAVFPEPYFKEFRDASGIVEPNFDPSSCCSNDN